MTPRPLALCVLVGLLLPDAARAEPDCSLACLSLDCRLATARCQLDAGRPEAARDLLKPLRTKHPESTTLRLLLARAYHALGNQPWARRTLLEAAELAPRDCQVRSWLVWLHLQGAELDDAASLLRAEGCPDSTSLRVRFALLEATLAHYRKASAEARQAVARARSEREALSEDRAYLESLAVRLDPRARPPIRLRLELGGGYTTNGLMSTPADVANTAAATDSATATVDLRVEVEPRWRWRLQPVLGLSLRSLVLGAEAVSDFTYLDLGVRPGLRAGPVAVFYAGQLLLLRGGDAYSGGSGPRWFYETHRVELEWEPRPWLTVFGGGGRSVFREQPRSRTEVDGGAGLLGSVRGFRLLGGLSLRSHQASHQAYDLWGGSLIASAGRAVGPLWLRARLLLGFDLYSRSAGYFEASERRDLLLKAAAEIWSRPFRGARVGLSYELSDRFSTASSYAYVDHRPLLRVSWSFDWDPWLPRVAGRDPRQVAIPFGAAAAAGGLEAERIQDLLRQEDAARRGSSCIN